MLCYAGNALEKQEAVVSGVMYQREQVIKAAEDASAAERSFLLLEKRADADREESRCLGAQKDVRISELEAQVQADLKIRRECSMVCV